jgi:DNA-binding PadR family transcriptional regulator
MIMRHTFDTSRDTGYGRGHGAGRHGREWEGRRGDREDRRGETARGERGGRWDGHGRRGGRGGRPRVGKGDVRAAILLLLAEEPLHGYQLIQRIEERSGGVWRPSPGSVYPALQLLEDEALVRSEQEEGRRVFHLTEAGTVYVTEQRAELEAARDAVTDRANPRAQVFQELVHQLAVAVDQVTQVGTPAQLDAAQEALVALRRQLYRILADDLSPSDRQTNSPEKGDDAYV